MSKPSKARAERRPSATAVAQSTPSRSRPRNTSKAGDQGLVYRVDIADLHAHLYRVSISVARPAATQRLSLPVWIPGSYLVREFARHLQGLEARQGGEPLTLSQIDKHTWDVLAPRTDAPLELRYQVYAFDNSVRAAWLDTSRAFFNGTSLFLRVHGQDAATHHVEIRAVGVPPTWQLATTLTSINTDARGFGVYRAEDYDELADSPVEMGAFWNAGFKACGVRHRLVVAGASPSFDGARLLADTQRICETAIRFWHGKPGSDTLEHTPPQRDYVFMLNAIDDGYGGLEHRHGAALICARKDLPRLPPTGAVAGAHKQPEGYATLLGLISHEYFHTWNVKRLRPAEFARYDYERENYTQLLWFFEGFTSYYDDLLLRRAGLLDDAAYLKALTRSLNQVLQSPGRAVQSVAQASFDAWVKYYRPDENTANITVSYYTKGAAVALCLDLNLRAEGRGISLDTVMRGLWQRCDGGPMREQDLLDELRACSAQDWAAHLQAWVHGTGELPLRELLEQHGVGVHDDPAQTAQALGLRAIESSGIVIKTVLRDGVADRAGFAAGDEWLGLEVAAAPGVSTGKGSKSPKPGRAESSSSWRLQRLDDLALYAAPGAALVAIVARDRRILTLPFAMPFGQTTWRLSVRDAKRVSAWLSGA